jgi:hypothetical protein
MRKTPWLLAEPFRLISVGTIQESRYGDNFGLFVIPYNLTGVKLRIIASAGEELIRWEHVSVSLPKRCPNWLEMSHIKKVFWDDNETVMQLHVPESEHINCHPYCLHLWRPIDQEIPRPPSIAVG